jgi:hypothetical protein
MPASTTSGTNWIEQGDFVNERPMFRQQQPNRLRELLKNTIQGGKSLRIPVSALPGNLKGLRTRISALAKSMGYRAHVIQQDNYLYMWLDRKGLQTGTGRSNVQVRNVGRNVQSGTRARKVA